MRLGIGTNLQSFCFPTRGRSEIGIFARLTTTFDPAGDLMWMSICKPMDLLRNS
jgi:hypothetical protein